MDVQPLFSNFASNMINSAKSNLIETEVQPNFNIKVNGLKLLLPGPLWSSPFHLHLYFFLPKRDLKLNRLIAISNEKYLPIQPLLTEEIVAAKLASR